MGNPFFLTVNSYFASYRFGTAHMREATFSKQNHEKWKGFETKLANRRTTHPDELADLFIEVTDDLAFAQTYYPNSKTAAYLNGLAINVHQAIYRNKKERGKRIVQFWWLEVPQAIARSRRHQLIALIIFVTAALCGIISTLKDGNFVREILGDAYVNITLENIKKNDPMGIYKGGTQLEMFFRITVNNIRVALITIILGFFFTIGTYTILLYNGVMIGVFFTFLFQQGVGTTAMHTVWIHGVIEIASISIAGGAGILLGNSIVFPGSYTRLESFKKGARMAAKIAVGLVPLIIIAGFLESFVTRHYQHLWVGIAAIVITLPFIIWYYILQPIKVYRKYGTQDFA